MWISALLIGAATASEAQAEHKPEVATVALGARISSGSGLAAVARYRSVSAVSVDVWLGPTLRSNKDTQLFNGLPLQSADQTRGGFAGAQVRLPLLRATRQDLLFTLGGGVGRSRAVNSVIREDDWGDSTSIMHLRSANAFIGLAIDHWLTPRWAVTLGGRAASAHTSRMNRTTNDVQDAPTTSTGVGFGSSMSLSVTGTL